MRLTQLVDALTGQFAGVNTEADERLEDAIEQQLEQIEDHVLMLPVEAAGGLRGARRHDRRGR